MALITRQINIPLFIKIENGVNCLFRAKNSAWPPHNFKPEKANKCFYKKRFKLLIWLYRLNNL